MTWVVVGVALLLAAAWYLSCSAARLDRLHAQVEGALSTLDAPGPREPRPPSTRQHRRLDPASALLVAAAASEAPERTTVRLGEDDLLEGQHFGGWESVESDLTQSLDLALTPDVVAEVTAQDGLAAGALSRLEAASRRVQLARRFHNNAVKDVQRVREKAVVRSFPARRSRRPAADGRVR